MPALRRQFFLSYAVIGSFMPLLSVFLWQEAGFAFWQIGLAVALTNIPMVLSPAFITLLADRQVDSRRILAAAFVVSALVLSAIFLSRDNVPLTLALFVFHGLAFVAMLPLQDGFFFSVAEHARRTGEIPLPYPKVRVWGTVGFILPSILIFFLLRSGERSVSVILPCAVMFCVLSFANTFTLPKLPPLPGSDNASGRLPTLEALAQLFSPRARFLCLGLGLGYMATVGYYTFVSIYFREAIGIPASVIGLIINLGVFLEIFFTVWMPEIQARIRLKGIIVVGLAGMALRMILLATVPTVWTAVLTQIVHGMEVLALFVAPIIFINRLAGDRFRNSIQGVFTMAVGGSSRIIGAIVAGFVATIGLSPLLVYTAALAVAACVIIFVGFGPGAEGADETN